MNGEEIKLLLIEDQKTDARLVQNALSLSQVIQFDLEWVDRLAKALEALSAKKFDLILMDMGLPDCQGTETFLRVQVAAPQTPIVVLTDLDDEEIAVKTMQMGAQDYVLKYHMASQILGRVVRYAIERHRVLQAAARDRDLLRTLIDALPDYVYVKDTQSRFVINNRAHLRVLGAATQEEAAGKSDADFFPPELARQYLADEQAVIQSGQPLVDREETTVDRERNTQWLLTTKVPLRDSAGDVIGLVGISRDVSTHKRAEDALERERYLLHALMDNMPDSIYFKDTESRFVRVNNACAKKFGLRDTALAIGKTDADFFSETHARQALADEVRVMRTGQPLVGLEEMETYPDGSVTWCSSTKMPLRDATGRIVGTFGISRDITLRKRAEQALAERTEQLRERNQQMQEDLNMARELQLAMLPQRFPVVPHNVPQADSALRFFSFYLPSGAVSGDFFDVIPLSDTSVGVFVCDVMGHDVRAALITAMMRALVEELGPVAGDPGQLLTQMNRDLCGLFRQTTATMFATACYLVADVARGKLLYASAGHPSPLHLHRSAGTVGPVVADDERGPALGLLMENVTYRTSQRPMMPGDLIMLFTDGLFEIENSSRETYGQQRLVAAALQRIGLPPSELFDTLIDDVREFAANSQFTDDVCLLGMEVSRLAHT